MSRQVRGVGKKVTGGRGGYLLQSHNLNGIIYTLTNHHKRVWKTKQEYIFRKRKFIEVGQELLEQARRYEKPLSLLIIDVDYFKKINDSYGHVFGDKVLKNVANLLNNNIRVCDTLARFGGEEFVIILPETTGEDAVELGQKLRTLIEHTSISYDGEQTINCTVSIGVTQFDTEIENLNELINRADIALYRAKESGRNQTLFFET